MSEVLDDWLDEFTMFGVELNAGEKTLMRMAIKKERERIIKLLESAFISDGESLASAFLHELITLIKGEK